MPFLKIENLNETISYNPAVHILNNLLMAGIKIETYCGGRGRCGRCRIKILSESKYISPKNKIEKGKLKHLINEGWRLSCQTYALRDITIYIPTPGTKEGIIE